jgi:maleylpyruvate isomerase
MTLKLYSYYRSSASYRVRIALNLKGLDFQYLPVHLVRDSGEQFAAAYLAMNAQALVPMLVDDDRTLTQSLAIIEYLEDICPEPPLLPKAPAHRAYVRQIALSIACEIHPLNNLRVLGYLSRQLGVTDSAKAEWKRHWVQLGFRAMEAQLSASPARGTFCFGELPTIADCCLVPQLFNARRLGVELGEFPTLCAIDAACQALPAFERAQPSRQPDAASSAGI